MMIREKLRNPLAASGLLASLAIAGCSGETDGETTNALSPAECSGFVAQSVDKDSFELTVYAMARVGSEYKGARFLIEHGDDSTELREVIEVDADQHTVVIERADYLSRSIAVEAFVKYGLPDEFPGMTFETPPSDFCTKELEFAPEQETSN